MAVLRIGGTTLPQNKTIVYAIPYLYGIGLTTSRAILAELNIDPIIRTKDLSETDANRIRERIEKGFKIEGDLRREVMGNIKRLRDIGAYRGSRHSRRLPVRGQRTKTNSRTVRGNVRKTSASGRKLTGQKT